MAENETVTFVLGEMAFEYDENKNRANIEKHGISFQSAARVFFDYDRIEFYDEENSRGEERYNTIGNLAAGNIAMWNRKNTVVGDIGKDDVIFVVYTERIRQKKDGKNVDITRLISARYATNFERGLYYGKY